MLCVECCCNKQLVCMQVIALLHPSLSAPDAQRGAIPKSTMLASKHSEYNHQATSGQAAESNTGACVQVHFTSTQHEGVVFDRTCFNSKQTGAMLSGCNSCLGSSKAPQPVTMHTLHKTAPTMTTQQQMHTNKHCIQQQSWPAVMLEAGVWLISGCG